jgi:hypothetical protein
MQAVELCLCKLDLGSIRFYLNRSGFFRKIVQISPFCFKGENQIVVNYRLTMTISTILYTNFNDLYSRDLISASKNNEIGMC